MFSPSAKCFSLWLWQSQVWFPRGFLLCCSECFRPSCQVLEMSLQLDEGKAAAMGYHLGLKQDLGFYSVHFTIYKRRHWMTRKGFICVACRQPEPDMVWVTKIIIRWTTQEEIISCLSEADTFWQLMYISYYFICTFLHWTTQAAAGFR